MFVVAVVGTYLVDLGYSNEALPVFTGNLFNKLRVV